MTKATRKELARIRDDAYLFADLRKDNRLTDEAFVERVRAMAGDLDALLSISEQR